jgi:hypothetical protein
MWMCQEENSLPIRMRWIIKVVKVSIRLQYSAYASTKTDNEIY